MPTTGTVRGSRFLHQKTVMSAENPITGEVSNSKVAAIFATDAVAVSAATRVRDALGLTHAQVRVIRPGDPTPGRKLEPESQGILRTMIKAHTRLGIAGVVAGVLVFALLYARGSPMIVNSAVAALLVLVFFGAVAGLMLGGLVTLRPDHDPYIHSVLSAIKDGRIAVVVHAFDTTQRDQAEHLLRDAGGETVSTL